MNSDVKEVIDRGRSDIVFFAEYFLGITLHPGQIRFLQGADGMVNILVPGNRFGKTVIISVRHIWYCFYKIGLARGDGDVFSRTLYQTAALGPSSDVLDVDYTTIKQIMTSSFVISREGEPIRTNQCRLEWYIMLDKCHNNPPYMVQFKDNTRILFFSGGDDKFSKVQGKKFGYGSYDEGGRSHHLKYELDSNLLPRFSEMAAPIDITSTPEQRSPSIIFHYEMFQLGIQKKRGYRSFTGSAYENTYLPEHHFTRLEEQYKGNPLRDQVIEGKFIFGGTSYFMSDDILACSDENLNAGVNYEDGHTYIVGVDTAMGSDEMVYTVLDTTAPDRLRLVKQVSAQGSSKSPQLHMDDFCRLVDEYRHGQNVKIILETFNGESGRFYQDMPYEYKFFTKCWGTWQPPGTSPEGARQMKRVSKEEMLISLRKVLASRKLRLPNEQELLNQLSLYREDDRNLSTDRVISLALATWLATDGRPKNPSIIFEPVTW